MYPFYETSVLKEVTMDQENNNQNGYGSSAPPPQQNYYYQQPYYGGYYYGYPPPQRTNPLGIVSMILGIVSVVIAVVLNCCAPGVNMPFAIAAIVTGILQLKSKTNQNGRGMGMAGLICGIVSVVIFLLVMLGYLALFLISIFSESSSGSYNYY